MGRPRRKENEWERLDEMTGLCRFGNDDCFLFDWDDFDLIRSHHWLPHYSKGKATGRAYAYSPRTRRTIFVYRLILGIEGCGRELVVDHINGNCRDNRRCNLRACSHVANTWNKPKARGYRFVESVGRWQAYIKMNNHFVHLGHFDTEAEAKAARVAAERICYGHYAALRLEYE